MDIEDGLDTIKGLNDILDVMSIAVEYNSDDIYFTDAMFRSLSNVTAKAIKETQNALKDAFDLFKDIKQQIQEVDKNEAVNQHK